MIFSSVTYFFIGAAACTIGAVPFGLVNLSVVNVAVSTNIQKSMPIALGAAVVEILFALTALFAGTLFGNILDGNIWVNIIVLGVLLAAGIFFWFKKNDVSTQKPKQDAHGFLKGALLNLMSIQVLLFWVVAVTFLTVRNMLPTTLTQVFLFIIGVWIAKIAVLRVYAILGQKVVEKSQVLSKNINRIIGVMLIVIAFIQVLRF